MYIVKVKDRVKVKILKFKMLKSPEIKPQVWKRLIDDIFFIWTDTEENLDKFLEDLNKFHPSLRFTYEKSREKINFLDVHCKFQILQETNFLAEIIKSVSEYFKAIKKSHDSQLFRMIHITIKKIIIGNNQPAHNVLGTSPEGPLKVLTSGTYKKPLGDSQGTNTKN